MAKLDKSFSAFPQGDPPLDQAASRPQIPASTGLDLTNHFLIAMPSTQDYVFGGSVVYLCEHNANGALGLVINKATDITMDKLFERIDLTLEIAPDHTHAGAYSDSHAKFGDSMSTRPVMFGGPVQIERGFVLHSLQKLYSSTLKVSDSIAMTTSKDVLEEVADGSGPHQVLVSLGCAGWDAGQLEDEIARNGWLTVAADPAIIFDLPIADRFQAALKLLGIDPCMLTGEFGRA
ncbi:YqgE/AlgH family protein [Glaciimonas immobilis]|uniref:UPF0301 protein HNR39_002737 n=1 Tax=Glaciimonas immobilis TaxID=728004 RepID=A0A840RSV4_9BURK|nr:YqgE/AlgH family protein [Glaciimonas immobilis]KAF3997434.1 YqgE/AlgH family protein [Glaciimonas immobilis]MBB5200895.1 putative transcriptional regulator [Glaciimonas immobilis]